MKDRGTSKRRKTRDRSNHLIFLSHTILLTSTPYPAYTIGPIATNSETPSPDSSNSPNLIFSSPPLVRPDYDSISGRYLSEDPEKDRVCILLVSIEPEWYPQEIGIELACDCYGRTTSQGYALEKVQIEDKVAVVSHNFLPEEPPCYIVFSFKNDQVIITQIGRDWNCGFGHGTYVGGTYVLVGDTPQKLGCNFFNMCDTSEINE
jgi:hypothetical protein